MARPPLPGHPLSTTGLALRSPLPAVAAIAVCACSGGWEDGGQKTN